MDNAGYMGMDEKLPEELKHARKKLEFDSVVEIMVDYAHSQRTRSDLFSMQPLDSTERVETSQREIMELVKLHEMGREIPLSGWLDSYELLKSVRDAGAVATAEELVKISEAETRCRKVKDFLNDNRDEAGLISRYSEGIDIDCHFTGRVAEVIGDDYEVLDSASRELRVIRRGISALRDNLRKKSADFIARKGGGEGYEFVTVRGERFVVSLPRHQASSVKGIVHQESSSGASLYIEPIEFVAENNKLESLVQDEKREVQRILGELTGYIFEERERFLKNQDVLKCLDIINSKALFARRFRCSRPRHEDGGRLNLREARHPLLEKRFSEEGRAESLQPLDFDCERETWSVVISGPNAGGKTVALKTVGLLVMMDRAGLPVPALDGSIIPPCRGVFVDIGDDQSIEKSLSTFSSRIRRLDIITQLAGPDSLVLIDEVGDGTDPDEGAALAEAALDYFVDQRVKTIVTTHMRRLKIWAHVKEGALNATLEFDQESLKPLFRLRLGVPGRSWGIEVAGRLGLSGEIVSRARDIVGSQATRMEELLTYLEETKQALDREREEISSREKYLDQLVSSYNELTRDFRDKKDKMAREAREEALNIVSTTRRDMENLIRKIRSSSAERGVIKEAKSEIEKSGEGLEEKLEKARDSTPLDFDRIKPGMWCEIEKLGKRGRVVSKAGKSRVFLELMGGVRVETRVKELIPCEKPREKGRPSSASWSAGEFKPVSKELMVRGMDRMEALEKVDMFVDRAVLQGLRKVTIIHGIGRGILRQAIYKKLKDDPRVASVHPGEPALGGDGVAVVELK